MVYIFAAGAAEKRASGRPSRGDGQDRVQAAAIASYMYDHADASDPRVVAALRGAEILADAMIQNPTTWQAIERVAKALRRRKHLSGRDVQEIIRGVAP